MSIISRAVGWIAAYGLFHPPRRKNHRLPPAYGLEADDVSIRTDDGITLHTWAVAGDAAGIAVLGHGIGMSKSASLSQARILHDQGWHVVLFDHRNHGRSQSDRTASHLANKYSRDITACVQYARERWGDDMPLIVWGFSFSTFPTLQSLAMATANIDGVLFDSGPGLELESLLRDYARAAGLPLPRLIRPLVSGPSYVDAFAIAAERMLGTTWPVELEDNVAMLFLVAAKDEIVKPEQTLALAARYSGATVIQFDARHLQSRKANQASYENAVAEFLSSIRQSLQRERP